MNLKHIYGKKTITSIIFFIMIVAIINITITVNADETTFKSPNRTGDIFSDFLYPDYAFVSNNQYTRASFTGDQQDYSYFSFNLEADVIIDGIQVDVEGTAKGEVDFQIQLSKNGGSSWTAGKQGTFITSIEDQIVTLGGSNDLWGTSWVPSDFDDGIFYLCVTHLGGTTSFDKTKDPSIDPLLAIDHIQVKVYYTIDVNQPPVANDDGPYDVYNNVGTHLDVLANDSDPDGSLDPDSIIITAQASHGTAVALSGEIGYTPNIGYVGSDSFRYTVDDNEGATSNEALVRINVIEPPSDDPIANDDSYPVDEGQTIDVLAPGVLDNDDDPNGDSIYVSDIINNPSYSAAFSWNSDGSFTYEHDGSETTTDSFVYEINDGNGGTDTATVTITINPVNDAPNQPTNPNPDGNTFPGTTTQVTLQVDVTDVELDAMDVSFYDSDDILIDTDNSVSSGSTASVIWDSLSPGQTYNWYVIIDDSTDQTTSSTWSFTINQASTNTPPVAVDDTATVDEDSSDNIIDVLNNDYDTDVNDVISIDNIVSDPSHGTAVIVGGHIEYTPDSDYYGSDSFIYSIVDDNGSSPVEATVDITITNIDDSSTVVGVSPANDSTNQPLTVTLSVDIFDSDDTGTTTITFYNASDDSILGSDSISGSGTIQTTWNNLNRETTYIWYYLQSYFYDVPLPGGCSQDYYFTTSGYTTPTISYTIDDMNREITIVSTDSGILWDNISISGICNTSELSEYVTAGDQITDCYGTVIMTYILTDEEIINHTFPNNVPDQPSNPNPADDATGVGTSPTLRIDVSDIDGDTLTVTFYNAENNAIIDSYIISGSGTASATLSGLSYNTEYSWYANVTDKSENSTSEIFSFTTKAESSNPPSGGGGGGGGGGAPPALNTGGPKPPVITGPKTGKPDTEYSFEFSSEHPNNQKVRFKIDWGDGKIMPFGDCYNAREKVEYKHTYKSTGTFEITAQAKDLIGTKSEWSEAFKIKISVTGIEQPIEETNKKPIAKIGFIETAEQDKIVFDATQSYDEDGKIISYLWDFGDGTTSNDSKPEHIYTEPGQYTVTLTVKDDQDETTIKTIELTIEPESSVNTDTDDTTDNSESQSNSQAKGTIGANLSFVLAIIMIIVIACLLGVFILYKHPEIVYGKDNNANNVVQTQNISDSSGVGFEYNDQLDKIIQETQKPQETKKETIEKTKTENKSKPKQPGFSKETKIGTSVGKSRTGFSTSSPAPNNSTKPTTQPKEQKTIEKPKTTQNKPTKTSNNNQNFNRRFQNDRLKNTASRSKNGFSKEKPTKNSKKKN